MNALIQNYAIILVLVHWRTTVLKMEIILKMKSERWEVWSGTEINTKLKIVMTQSPTTKLIKACLPFYTQWKQLFNAQSGVKEKDKIWYSNFQMLTEVNLNLTAILKWRINWIRMDTSLDFLLLVLLHSCFWWACPTSTSAAVQTEGVSVTGTGLSSTTTAITGQDDFITQYYAYNLHYIHNYKCWAEMFQESWLLSSTSQREAWPKSPTKSNSRLNSFQ